LYGIGVYSGAETPRDAVLAILGRRRFGFHRLYRQHGAIEFQTQTYQLLSVQLANQRVSSIR